MALTTRTAAGVIRPPWGAWRGFGAGLPPGDYWFSEDTRFKEIFDVAPDEVPQEEILKRVHPDDAESVLDGDAAVTWRQPLN